MLKKVFTTLVLAAVLAALLPSPAAKAETGKVLLVYSDKEKMAVLRGLITACGMESEPIDSVEYENGMAKDYEYIVLQDSAPLQDVLTAGKRVVCIGDSFKAIPGIEIKTVDRVTHGSLNVYGSAQTVIVEAGTAYVSGYNGETVGSINLFGSDYPLGVVGERILYAPYLNADDLSVFAAAQLLNRYFGRLDGGKTFVLVDEVYPFHDTHMLTLTADRLYENGIPFIMRLMPVYYNTGYPSFTRYLNALRYIQSKSGSFVMHDPLVTGNELVGDPLDARMEKAYATFEDNGVHVFEAAAFPYEVSMDLLSAITPQNELFVSLPIDTVIRFDMFESEAELNEAVEGINGKWLQIGDYRRFFTDDDYVDRPEAVENDYPYRPKEVQTYEFLVNAGNRFLLAIVLLSAFIIAGLILPGARLYREKFLKKGK